MITRMFYFILIICVASLYISIYATRNNSFTIPYVNYWKTINPEIPPAIAPLIGKYTFQRRPNPVKLINGFVFHHEFDQLLIRMHELYEVVDYFILTESTFTHYGKPKELLFEKNKEKFSQFLPKIIHTVVDMLPDISVAAMTWEHERSMRNHITLLGIPKLPPLDENDLIIINDADEIISADVLRFLKHHSGLPNSISIAYRWTYYGYFWHNHDATIRTSIVPFHVLRNQYGFHGNNVRVTAPDVTIGSYQNFAGWHCSWCFPVVGWVAKLDASLRGDGTRWGDMETFHNVELLKEYRVRGTWFTGETTGIFTTPDSNPMFAPKWVLTNMDKVGYLVDPKIPSPE